MEIAEQKAFTSTNIFIDIRIFFKNVIQHSTGSYVTM